MTRALAAVVLTTAGVFAGCAARPAPLVDTAVLAAAEVESLVSNGCYRCLESAFAKAVAAGLREQAFESALLLAARSKELGLPHARWIAAARGAVPLAGAGWEKFIDIVLSIPLDPFRADRDALLIENAATRRQRPVLEQWRRDLAAGPGSSLFRSYLDPGLPTRTAESVVLGVPTADPAIQAVLEASFDRGRMFDDRDFELLTAAAQLGGLVLEAARTRPASAAATAPVPATPLVGSSPVTAALRARIERVAQTDFTVLIEGESETGKDLVARQIHDFGRRRKGPFVPVNCAAVVETLLEAELFGIEERTATGVRGRRGKFEHAEGGTLFLDEVSDLSLAAQAKLLRAIQDLAIERVGTTGTRRVNTRIVAATNRPLSELVERKLFRADLFYRLGGVEIQVPALRQRREDISELAAHFLAGHRTHGERYLSEPAIDALRLYDWPGNVRELERMMERAVALGPARRIELDDLPAHARGEYGEVLAPSIAAGHSMRAWASRYARLVFERCDKNKRRASELLDISYHTLDAYLRYGNSPRPAGKRVPAWAQAADARHRSEASTDA